MKQIKPVSCFGCFFQGYFEFCSKLFLTVAVFSLGNICSDACATTKNLFGHHIFTNLLFLFHQILIQTNDPYGKSLGF